MPIEIESNDVISALDDEDSGGDVPTESEVSFEIRLAETIVNDELVPAASDDGNLNRDRLKLTGALIAAAYVEDGQTGPVDSVSQLSASVSFDTDKALSYWRRAKQLDPTGKLGQLDKPDASLGVPNKSTDSGYYGVY